MLFNSLQFLLFLFLVRSLYGLLKNHRAQNNLLLLASYLFYGAWDWRFLGLIFLSTCIDFFAARQIDQSSVPSSRRLWLYFSLALNLGILGLFKYLNFGLENMAALLELFGFNPHFPFLNIILPVGISFYTFQTIGYTLDVYNRRRPAVSFFPDFALYVAYFPQLVAGPIERSTHLLPQIESPRPLTRSHFQKGLLWIILGYFHKVVIADSIAPLVNEAYASPEQFSGSLLFLATIGFTLQIYGDFAGYTLIARGVSAWFGIDLTQNFRRPFFARDPSDFWRRWHISLSDWFREYLFTPIALWSARNHPPAVSRNLPVLLTFALIGIWHGAGWNFFLFGLYWGLWIVLHQSWKRSSYAQFCRRFSAYPFLANLCTLFGTVSSFVLFRSTSISDAGLIYLKFFHFPVFTHPVPFYAQVTFILALPLFALMAFEEFKNDSEILLKAPSYLRLSIYFFAILLICIVGFRPVPFIYFQF